MPRAWIAGCGLRLLNDDMGLLETTEIRENQ